MSEEAYLETTILIGLCLVALCVGQFIHRRHLHALPESGATILVGFLFTLLEDQSEQGHAEEQVQRRRYFDPIFFNLVLLPPIIFESGFHLNMAVFVENIYTIVLLAVVGTLASTAFTWAVVYYAGQLGWTATPLPIREAGVFAALISAVDPVATLATFGTLKVDHTLSTVVFGESVLNDAVSLIIFSTISTAPDNFSPSHVPAVAKDFLLVCVSSVLLGVGTAMLAALTFKGLGMGRHAELPLVEVVMFWCFSYLAFIVPEVPHLAAIVSSLFAGIYMALYAAPNLSLEARHHLGFLLQAFSTLCDTLIFLLVGMAIVFYLHAADPYLALLAVGACLAGRWLHIFSLTALANTWRAEPIPLRFQCVMAHSGLRGAIAVALAVQVEGPHAETIVAATMVTVLFTVFVLGGTTKLLLDMLNIETGVPPYAEDPSKLLPNWVEERLIDPGALALRRRKQQHHSTALARATSARAAAARGQAHPAAAGKGLDPLAGDGRGELQVPPGRLHGLVRLAQWLRLPSTTQSKYDAV